VMLPFVIMGSIPGLEIVHPMAIVILSGLLTSTFLSLFVLPALYLRFGAGPRLERARGREPFYRSDPAAAGIGTAGLAPEPAGPERPRRLAPERSDGD
jgi:AcrB/AcrD/AcrF family protein